MVVRCTSLVFRLVLFACGQPGRAEVVRLEISERSPFADGKSFGEVGPYERISGKAVSAIDAKDRSNGEMRFDHELINWLIVEQGA